MINELADILSTQQQKDYKELINSDNIELKTEVYKYEIKHLMKIYSIAQTLNSLGFEEEAKQIYDYINYFLKLKVSYARRGRKEVVEAMKSEYNSFMLGQQQLNDINKL